MQTPISVNLRVLFSEAFASRSRPAATEILRPPVTPDGDRLRDLLATASSSLAPEDVRTIVEGNLWRLTPRAFLYFLPTFLDAALASYGSLSVFASELVGALTKPSRADVVEAIDRLEQGPPGLALPAKMTDALRTQQLEWVDSGAPEAIFHERFDALTAAEGAAILTFFEALQRAHGADFPFDEIETAIDRHWGRYRTTA